MIHPATDRLIWKEYRAQRGLWFGILAIMLLLIIILIPVWYESFPFENTYIISIDRDFVAFLVIAFSFVYAIACGAALFGAEREDRSAAFLQTLPISAWQAVFIRFTFGIVSTICLAVAPFVLWMLFVDRYGGWLWITNPYNAAMGLFLLLLIAKTILWGIFFSILSGRVLVAVACSTILTFGIPLGRVPLSVSGNSLFFFDTPYDLYLYPYFDLLTITALFLLNIATYNKWSRGELKFQWFLRAEKKQANVWKKYLTRRKTLSYDRNSFRSLLWLSRKEVLHASLVPVIVAGFICLIGYLIAKFIAFDFSIVIIPFIPIFMGVWVYRENHLRNTNRFCAEKGVSAGKFWITKQLVWFTATALIFFAFFWADNYFEKMFVWERLFNPFGLEREFFERYSIDFTRVEFVDLNPKARNRLSDWKVLRGNFHYCLFAYCCAMWCSHRFRRTITAFVAAVIATALFHLWWFYMNWFELPIVWTVYPLVIALFLSSYLSTHNWLLERGKLLRVMRTSGLLAGTVSIVLISVAWHRIATAPEVVREGYYWYELPLAPSEYELETGRMYRRATEFLVSLQSITNNLPESASIRKSWPEGDIRDLGGFEGWGGWEYTEIVGSMGWGYSTETERAWLRENRETIELVLAASNRDSCAMENPYNENATPHHTSHPSLTYKLIRVFKLLLFSARKLESEGKLEEAWMYYLHAMRMCFHLDEHPHEIFRVYHSQTFDWAHAWRKNPKQNTELLEKAFYDLKWGKIVKTKRDEAGAIALMQIEREKSHAFEGESAARYSNRDLDRLLKRAAATFMPWEKTRALRVLDFLNDHAWYPRFGHERDVDDWKSDPSLALMPRPDRLTLNMRSRTSFSQVQNKKNLFLIQLALNIEKRKTGKLPERLEDLQGEYFDELPYDPASGESYRYYRNGLPIVLLYEGGEIKANTPFLFTPTPVSHRERLFLIQAGAEDNKMGKDYYTVLTNRSLKFSTSGIPLATEWTVRHTIHIIEK